MGWLVIVTALLACAPKHKVVPTTETETTPCDSAVLAAPQSGPARFDAFLAGYVAATDVSRAELLANFVSEQRGRGGFPIVESDGTAVFLYVSTGSEHDIRLIGDFRPMSFFKMDWDQHGQPLSLAVAGGKVWFTRMRFQIDARLDYQISIDGKGAPDPLNPRNIESGYGGPSSELVMPAVQIPSPRLDVEHGAISTVEGAWAHPKITVYLPPGYDSRRRYPVIYTADGTAWLELIRLPAILDDLIARHAIEPAIAIMIDAAEDRSVWYLWNPLYLEYLDKVVRYVDSHYATRADPAGRIHVGTSAGARAGLQVALERSSTFGKVALLSPALSGYPHIYEPFFSGRRKPAPALRVWMSAGTYEGTICEDTRSMARWFRDAGVKVKLSFLHESHSFGNWRHVAGDALTFLLAP